jgi:hypothetical protein
MSIVSLSQSVPAVVMPRDGLSIVVDVALILMAGSAVVFLVFAAVQLRRFGSILQALRAETGQRAEPILERGRSIAQNVEYISATVRTDVERVNGSVRALSDRLQQASDRMEERIDEFNALMDVVQGEAESAFLGTASTVRGLRAGARTLSGVDSVGFTDRGDPERVSIEGPGSTSDSPTSGNPEQDSSERSA